MGELFRVGLPKPAVTFTGGHSSTANNGKIKDEHVHRYLFAREICRGKRVLDITSGAGYGSALLAQSATHVVGVDVDSAAVRHAASTYVSPNLVFKQGQLSRIPLTDQSVDAVVSFDTLERVVEQEAFRTEVQRVLRPEGLLLISTPDSDIYNGQNGSPDPTHLRELNKAQFQQWIGSSFRNTVLFRQRFMVGSALFPDGCTPGACIDGNWIYEQRDSVTFEGHRHLPRSPYLLAIASNGALPQILHSLYLERVAFASPKHKLQDDAEALTGESPIDAIRSEMETLRFQTGEREANLNRALNGLRQELVEKNQKLQDAKIFAQQQTLTVLRLQRQFASRLGNVVLPRESTLAVSESLSSELEQEKIRCQHLNGQLEQSRATVLRHEQTIHELANLKIPVWMRRLVPNGLRPMARKLKRSIVP